MLEMVSRRLKKSSSSLTSIIWLRPRSNERSTITRPVYSSTICNLQGAKCKAHRQTMGGRENV